MMMMMMMMIIIIIIIIMSLFYDFTTLMANYKISATTNTHMHNVHTYQNKQQEQNDTIQCS